MRWGAVPKFSIAKAVSSTAVAVKNCRRGCWRTVPVRRPISSSGLAATSRPATVTPPLRLPSCRCGMSPFIMRSRVDLPDPLAPHSTTASPGSTARSMCSRVGSDEAA